MQTQNSFRDRALDWHATYADWRREAILRRLEREPDLIDEHRKNPRNQRQPRRSHDLEELLSHLRSDPSVRGYYIYQPSDWSAFHIVTLQERNQLPVVVSSTPMTSLDEAVHSVFLRQVQELRSAKPYDQATRSFL